MAFFNRSKMLGLWLYALSVRVMFLTKKESRAAWLFIESGVGLETYD